MAATQSTTYQLGGCFPDDILIFSMKNDELTCGGRECLKSSDTTAKNLYQIVLQIQDFFKKVFNLCGIDGKGKMVPFIIHWDQRQAQWECSGTNCKFRFNDSFAAMKEVVCHEYTHGVVSHLAPLHHRGEAGALNEAIADVLGIAFKHFSGGSSQNWNIAHLRNLSQHITKDSYKTESDVHDNSRIPSHAFYVSVQAYDGKSYGNIVKVWFIALKMMKYESSFEDFAFLTLHTAEMIRDDGRIFHAIGHGWVDVQVLRLRIPKNPEPFDEKSSVKAVLY